jgi:hypothetical protein
MSAHRCGVLTLANGGQYSSFIDLRKVGSDARFFGLLGLDAQEGGKTYSVQITGDAEPATGGNWFDLVNSAAVAVDAPVANAAKTMESIMPFTGVRIKASAAVTTGSTWELMKFVSTEMGGM